MRFRPKTDFPCTGYCFTEEECDLLSRYGFWMMALQKGWIQPTTNEQMRFVKCLEGACRPQSHFECLWLKYINSVEGERLEQAGREASDEDYHREYVALEEALLNESDPDTQKRLAQWLFNLEADYNESTKAR